MEISGSAAVTALARSTTADERSVKVLKKALDAQSQAALSLIAALPQPREPAASVPAHLGRNIDTVA